MGKLIHEALSEHILACITHENYVFIHKHFKANGFEISTRPAIAGLARSASLRALSNVETAQG